jgi:beta-galactosidase
MEVVAKQILMCLGLGYVLLTLSASARETTLLDQGWRFKQGDVTGAEQSSFDDKDWQGIALPHSWGWEEAQQGRNYYRGPGWYRRDLNIGPPKPGKRYFLRFEAAGSVADVFLNGEPLGQHRGAFSAFCFEATSHLSPTGNNLLAARVSNAPEKDIAPLSGDFCVFGGLYRSVHLIETDKACFALTDHGSLGVAWLQSHVSPEHAVLDVTAQISNGTKEEQPFTLVARVVDPEGKQVAITEQPITLMPGVTEPFWLKVEVDQPHLWQGRKDPYLYIAIIELRAADGAVHDSVEQPLGLRWFSVDPDKGFFLNGRPYHLHGVNRHQDRWNKGWAITKADQDEDMKLILDMGCTVIRCAHYQHSDYFYSLCDKAGLLVWAELSQVDKIDPSPEFAETSRNQLLDLIRQNTNHPSIFTWSLYNELRPGNPDPHRLLQDLKIVANGEDPTRPTIGATCTSKLPQMNKITDLLGWNIYPGWYSDWGPLSDYQDNMERYRDDSRHGGICISEYGAGANPAQHEEHPKQPKNDGQWHPEEYQAYFHEEAWKGLKSKPYIWGTFIWNMFDFTSYWRHEGGLLGRNDKGLVTYDRKTCKDAFYFYKANWNDEPMVYITSRRFTPRKDATTEIKVYSNTTQVELKVNGKSLGAVKPDDIRICKWPGVQLSPGVNKIEATGQANGQEVRDTCEWTLEPTSDP